MSRQEGQSFPYFDPNRELDGMGVKMLEAAVEMDGNNTVVVVVMEKHMFTSVEVEEGQVLVRFRR